MSRLPRFPSNSIRVKGTPAFSVPGRLAAPEVDARLQPNLSFFRPRRALFPTWSALMVLVLAHVSIFGHQFFIHTLMGGSLLVVVGTQLIGFGLGGAPTVCTSWVTEIPGWSECSTAFTSSMACLREGWWRRQASRSRFSSSRSGFWWAREPGRGAIVSGRRDAGHRRTQIFFTSFLLSIMGFAPERR